MSNRAAHILYCHCAQAQVVPAAAGRAVLDALGRSGAEFEAVADLCGAAARRDPVLKRLAARGAMHILACHPRAVRWLFAWADAPLAKDAILHDMRSGSVAEILNHPALANLLAPRERAKGRATARGKPAASSPGGAGGLPMPGEWVPWFPVIDYDRCKNCLQCVQFCLFGVYETDAAKKPRVVQPDKCKTGCPACARVCPESAIIFAKYKDGPISGEEGRLSGSSKAGVKADLASLGKEDLHDILRRRSALAKMRKKAADE